MFPALRASFRTGLSDCTRRLPAAAVGSARLPIVVTFLTTMFRAILHTARTPRALTMVPRLSRPAPLLPRPQRVAFSAAAGLSKEDVKARITDVLKSFEKVTPDKVQESSSFTEDLGLDSLDTVEVLMAVEEFLNPSHDFVQEFGIEIPDEEADEIKTVQQAIDYIAKTPEAH
ncbi:hypothetical protein JB92DRAFT_2789456 [Gautieria morchelliformis]|nr:hypothetical protein JB92DRAFT_2789456 [Gautieria morchelliformis]